MGNIDIILRVFERLFHSAPIMWTNEAFILYDKPYYDKFKLRKLGWRIWVAE